VPLLLAVALCAAAVVLVLSLLSKSTDVLGCQWDRAANGEPVASAECSTP
jgi:hypothetical protein